MSQEQTSTLPSGTRIDQYEIIDVLGQGGFGITYLVRDEGLQKRFALKEYFPEDLVRREGTSIRFMSGGNTENDYRWGLRKFYDEARLLAQFSHPNIVNVRRVFEANNSAYMLLDFIDGSTLEKWLRARETPPSQEELDRIAVPLLSALELVHENRSWHLDVSPENIMIRSTDGAPILLDFGASRFEMKQHSQLVSALVFKSGYSAPEQYTSNADRYGPWTDIYATGATLYRAIAGSRPTEATSRQLSDDMKTAAQVANGPYRQKFLRAIDDAMKLPPHKRPQNISEWRRTLVEGGDVKKAPSRIPGSSTIQDQRPWPFGLSADALPDWRAAMARVNPILRGFATKAQAQLRNAPAHLRDERFAKGLAVAGALLVLCAAMDWISPNRAFNPFTYVKMAWQTDDANGIAKKEIPIKTASTSLPSNHIDGRFIRMPVAVGSLPKDNRKGWIGINMSSVDLAFAKSLGLIEAKGVLVVSATAGGPAANAGLRVGDVIVNWNGTQIENQEHLRQRVADTAPGSQATLEAWRVTTENRDFLQTLRKLADEGNAAIMARLGNNYARGIGVARDTSEAVRWYTKSANAGNASGMVGLANMMLEGSGTEKDSQGALRLLRSAAETGSLEALHTLGSLLLDGRVERDPIEAGRLLRKAAEAGYAPSMLRVGEMIDRDNPQEAAVWYQRAADLGESGAMLNIGVLHANGRGVRQSDAMAMAWYKKAEALNHPTAFTNIAAMIDDGRGVDRRDPEQAADYIMQALEMGDNFAYRQMTENFRAWKRDFRLVLQKRLADAGFYSGALDGEFGQGTIAAIRAYANKSR